MPLLLLPPVLLPKVDEVHEEVEEAVEATLSTLPGALTLTVLEVAAEEDDDSRSPCRGLLLSLLLL